MEIILASASPRRRELLAQITDDFSIVPSSADENIEECAPDEFVQRLAAKKAAEVALRPEHDGKLVIGADTVVALEGKILGKPKNEEEAFRMLRALSGRPHAVYTGVCLACAKEGRLESRTEFVKTEVVFYELSDEFIRAYIESGSPMDKAGAYGIQDGGLVERIVGSYTNVVGFPKKVVAQMLDRAQKEWL